VKSEGIYTPWTFVAVSYWNQMSEYCCTSGLTEPIYLLYQASEAAVGSHFGGALPFIRHGLQNALVTSKTLRQVILAGVRRAIRMLAVAEFTSEDGALEVRVMPLFKVSQDSGDI
jgi:hypothetical protein